MKLIGFVAGREFVLLPPDPRRPRQRFQCHSGTSQYYTDVCPGWVCGWFIVHMSSGRSDKASGDGVVVDAFHVGDDAGSVFD